MGSKMIIDATKPVGRPFAKRINVPNEVMTRIKLKDWIPLKEQSKIKGGLF